MDIASRVLALFRFPYLTVEIVSTLPREVAVARIQGIVEAHNPLVVPFVRTNKLFAGEFSGDGFKLRRIIRYRNAMRPVIEGVFEPSPSGSRIRITMRPTHWIAGFFGLWIGGVTIRFLPSTIGLFSSNHSSATPGLSYIFALAIVCAIGTIGFNLEADRARKLLEGALQATPSAHVEKVLNNVAKPRFSRSMRLRLMPGAVLAGVAVLSWLWSGLSLGQSESFRVAQHFIQNDRTIRAELGSISSVQPISGDGSHKSAPGQQDEGIFEVNVTGALKSGVVLFGMVRENRVWSIKSAQLLEADGRTMLLAAPASD